VPPSGHKDVVQHAVALEVHTATSEPRYGNFTLQVWDPFTQLHRLNKMHRSRSHGRHGGRRRRPRNNSLFELRSVSPSSGEHGCDSHVKRRHGKRRVVRRRRRHSRACSQELQSQRYEEYDREMDSCWSRSPVLRTGVNAIPLGRRWDEADDRLEEEKETRLRVWVAHSDCAKIIGRGGRTMRELEAASRTKLKVQREDDMNTDTKERFVEIIGTRSEQKAALALLLDLATFCREDGGEVLKDIRASNPQGKTEAPYVIEVLPEEVGRVLGRKGETVKLLEKDSNTKIEVDKNTGRLEIYGQKEAREQALKLLLSEVTYAKGEDGAVIKDRPRPKPNEDAMDLPPYKLWVKDREAGRVIGRGG